MTTASDEVSVLRRAAEAMRQDHGPQHQRHLMWLAMSRMIATTAHQWEQIDRSNAWGDTKRTYAHLDDAVLVATAYIAARGEK